MACCFLKPAPNCELGLTTLATPGPLCMQMGCASFRYVFSSRSITFLRLESVDCSGDIGTILAFPSKTGLISLSALPLAKRDGIGDKSSRMATVTGAGVRRGSGGAGVNNAQGELSPLKVGLHALGSCRRRTRSCRGSHAEIPPPWRHAGD